MTSLPFMSRDDELVALRSLVQGAARRGGATLLRGPAGIGKSVLLELAEREAMAQGMTAVRVTAVQAETNLPFAGLHQLLQPVLAGLGELPAPQRTALSAVFALVDGPPPEPFLVALGALALLARAARAAPVLVVVDDSQWLDASTSQVLAFVARRLTADRIVLLAAIRDGYRTALLTAGLPELRLGPLPAADAAALLDAAAPALPAPVRARLLQQAAGNPLALIELPEAWRRRPPTGAVMPGWLPLTARLEQSFSDRVAEQPDLTRNLLLLAAANDTDSVAEILASAAQTAVTATVADLMPAAEAGLLTFDQGRLAFRHPLIRSAVYQAATTGRRHAAHAALAAVLGAYPDRRAWHRAAATAGHDDQVAGELAAAAHRALRRGGPQSALAAWERAAQLSADPHRRTAYLLRSAELAAEIGRPQDAASHLERAVAGPMSPNDARRSVWIRALLDVGIGRADRIGSALESVSAVTPEDSALVLRLFRAVAAYQYWADHPVADRSVVTAAAGRLDLDPGDPRRLAILALAAPLEYGREVLAHLHRIDPATCDDPTAAMCAGDAAVAVGGYDLAEGFYQTAADGLRRQGRHGLLTHVLTIQAWVRTYLGRWDAAVEHAREAMAVAGELGQPHLVALARVPWQMVNGLRGDAPAAGAAEGAERPAKGVVGAGVNLARGTEALSAGRYREAFRRLRAVVDPAGLRHYPAMASAGVGYLAEAALHSGMIEEGRSIVASVEALAAHSDATKVRHDLAYARAVLAAGPDAEAAFADALAVGEAWPFDRARARLAYGEWLRRRRRFVDAREPLRAARDAFDALGARPWGDRARRELRGAGERAAADRAADAVTLTAQELNIARLAAAGRSNREIAEQLFLSPRTIGSHLYRLFPKLGVASRLDLADRLRETGLIDAGADG